MAIGVSRTGKQAGPDTRKPDKGTPYCVRRSPGAEGVNGVAPLLSGACAAAGRVFSGPVGPIGAKSWQPRPPAL
jgi:hypothetical protein